MLSSVTFLEMASPWRVFDTVLLLWPMTSLSGAYLQGQALKISFPCHKSYWPLLWTLKWTSAFSPFLYMCCFSFFVQECNPGFSGLCHKKPVMHSKRATEQTVGKLDALKRISDFRMQILLSSSFFQGFCFARMCVSCWLPSDISANS